MGVVHRGPTHAENLDDIPPLLFGYLSAVAVPEELADHGILRRLEHQCLAGRTYGDPIATGELDLIEGRLPDCEEMDLRQKRQVEDVARPSMKECISKHAEVDLE